MYQDRIKKAVSPAERRFFERLGEPRKIQDYLDKLPINFELKGETYMSPRLVLKTKTAHCFEGALLAAAALAYHGYKPLLLDFQTTPEDEDHLVTLFQVNGYWGAISKTNHYMLRYRDPVYKAIRELSMSYFHEYFLFSANKTMRTYSKPFDLSRYAPEEWITTDKDLYWLAEAIDKTPHFPVAPKKNLRVLRKVAKIELKALELNEWRQPKAYLERE